MIEFNHAIEVSPDTGYNSKFDNTMRYLIRYLLPLGDIYLSRGIVEEKLLLWNQAIEDYQKANQLYKKNRPFAGDDPTVFSNLANAETGLLQWKEAYRDFSYAIKLKPDFIAPRIGLAMVQYQLGEYTAADSYFESLADDYPEFPDGLALHAVSLSRKGDMSEAKAVFAKAVELDSRYQDAEWVRDIRRWTPVLVADLTRGLLMPKEELPLAVAVLND